MTIHSGKHPIVVVGGGLAGLSFALAAAGVARPVLLVESSPAGPGAGAGAESAAALGPDRDASETDFDARSTALSAGARKIYQSLGVWDDLGAAACPIRRIEVSDQGHLGGVCFDRSEQGLEALGYVVENHRLHSALRTAVAASTEIELLAPAGVSAARPTPEGMQLTIRQGRNERKLAAALTVLAAGGESPLAARLGIERRGKSYGQYALAANIALERPHRNTAYERFTARGPLAVLPLPRSGGRHRASLVWTLQEAAARDYLQLPERELLPELQREFGPGMGRVTGIGRRGCFPLRLIQAGEQARPGLVLLGNAAHTLHPVAGQGFNLALRDCMALAAAVRDGTGRGRMPGDMAVLRDYLDRRKSDQERTILFTDLLVDLFSGQSTARKLFRRSGLFALDLFPPARNQLARHAMGLIPD